MSRPRIAVAIALTVLTVAALSGCSQAAPQPKVTVIHSPVGASPSPTVAAKPVYLAAGTAIENKPYFDLVNTAFFDANGSALGRQIIDNLVAAGFTKSDMQVTPDRTSIGSGTDSILFAVKIGTSCLIGQHGGGGYSSTLAPVLTTGGPCLIGITRQINW